MLVSQQLKSIVLISKAHDKKYPITWTYQDVYNRFQPSVEERSFDASNFIDYLQERQSSKGLYFAIQMVEDGSLNTAFWTLTDSLERWTQNLDHNPLIYDTSHGTNKYALKFSAFTTINNDGKTQILAYSLLDRETQESFGWVFTEFLKAFKQPPKIIFTDGDPAIAAAIKKIIHLLCTFHIGQNVMLHMKPLLVEEVKICVEVEMRSCKVGGTFAKSKILILVCYLTKSGMVC